MYEQNYRVSGDLYRLRQEAIRRERGRADEPGFSEKNGMFRSTEDVFQTRPDELRICWDGSSEKRDYHQAASYRTEEGAHIPIVEPGGKEAPRQNLLEKLNLKTDDLILIGLLIFLIYCQADWDIIIILGALILVGWFPDGLNILKAFT